MCFEDLRGAEAPRARGNEMCIERIRREEETKAAGGFGSTPLLRQSEFSVLTFLLMSSSHSVSQRIVQDRLKTVGRRGFLASHHRSSTNETARLRHRPTVRGGANNEARIANKRRNESTGLIKHRQRLNVMALVMLLCVGSIIANPITYREGPVT